MIVSHAVSSLIFLRKIQPVPEFSYSLTGVFCLFCCLFCLNFLKLYKYAYYKQGDLQPVNKNFGAMTFQLKFAIYLPHLKSFELTHFRRRLRCVDCRFYRESDEFAWANFSLNSS